MDYKEPVKHGKKKDKAREKHERFGGFSARHVRLTESLAEARTEARASAKGGTKGTKGTKEKPKKT